MSFAIFQNAKTPFQAIKKRSSKSWKIYFFPRGLTHVFGPKVVSFPTFVLGNIGQENVCDYILERKNAFLGYKNKYFKQLKNFHFSKGVKLWFWSKRKTRKVCSFPKGLVHGFSQKCNLRHSFFLFKKRPSKVLNDVVDRQIAFVDYKNIVQKKSQNFHFSKGVNLWFWSKKGHFSTFFFREYRPGKCFLRYSRTKKNAFWAIKTTSSKSRKIDIFPKWLTHSLGPKKAIFPTFFLGNIGQEIFFFTIFQNEKKRFSRL